MLLSRAHFGHPLVLGGSMSRIRFLLASLAFFSICSVATAQTYTPTQPDNVLTPADPIGVPPHVSSTGTNETINLVNGGLNVFVPALSLPQRGGWNITLGYFHDSLTWTLKQDLSNVRATEDASTGQWGDYYTYDVWMRNPYSSWEINLPTLQSSIEYVGDIKAIWQGAQANQAPVFCVTNWVFTDWSGNRHPFKNNSECSATGWVGYDSWSLPPLGFRYSPTDSTDGSWLRLDTSNLSDIKVTTKDGTTYHFTGYQVLWPPAGAPYSVSNSTEVYYNSPFSSMVDNTGQNTVTYSSGTLTDTVGRKVTISSSGISYTDSNGNPQTISTSTPGTLISYSFPNLSCSAEGTNFPLPWGVPTVHTHPSGSGTPAGWTTTLAFPASDSTGTRRTYTLQFDTLGRLVKIIYPSGGYSRYDYQETDYTIQQGQVLCSGVPLLEVAHKYECPSSTGSCSQEQTTTYAPILAGNAGTPFNGENDETDPTGAMTKHLFGVSTQWGSLAPKETYTYTYNSAGTLLRTAQIFYTPTQCTNPDMELPGTITTTLNDVSPTMNSQEIRQYEASSSVSALSNSCGLIDNPTEIDEYDFDGSVKRKTAQTWMGASDSCLYSDAAGGGHIFDRLKSRTVTDPASNVQSTLSYGYNSVGDITSKTVGGTGLTSLTTNYQRDAYGNITQVTDPKSNITKFGYTDNWAQTTCAPGSNSSAYLTSITDALNHITNFSYNPCTGSKASATDPNGARTSLVYDALGRMTTVNNPDGGQTITTYVDSVPNSATVTKLINSSSGLQLQTKTILDGFSRTIQTQLLSDPDGITYTDTTYDNLGRVATVSNPYRTSNDAGPTNGITSTFYDALSRTCLIVPPDGTLPSGGACPTTQPANTIFTTYSGNLTTVTDQAGKSRKSVTDALGRLTKVFEDPAGSNYETDYAYDAFGNLLTVNQKGGSTNSANWRTRTFAYNAFSQLVSATNPESNAITYTYDNDGNLTTKTSYAENQTNATPTQATGSVTISGSEACQSGTCAQGTVSIIVGGYTATANYGSGSSTSSLASALLSQLNSSSSPVTATVSGVTGESEIDLTSKATGPSANYSLSASVSKSTNLVPTQFSTSTSGSTLTGGSNPPTVTATYSYDPLNRITKKTFTDGTPTVTFLYDGATVSGCAPTLTASNPIGRRTGMCDTTGIEAWSYDSMGRALADQRTTSGLTKTTSYLYQPYVDGSLYQLTYPSGRVMTYTLASSGSITAARLASAVDQANSVNYATGAHYSPAGALASLTNGATIASTFLFSSRLQPCWIYATTGTPLPWNSSSTNCTSTAATGSLLDLKYNFNLGVSDNGNVATITNNRDNTRSQNFTYDSINRLATAQTQTSGVTIPNSNCWGLTFGYDPWGNLLTSTVAGPSGCGEPAPLNVTATTSNRISGYCYDAAGNLLVQGTCPTGSNPVYTYKYDAENHLASTAGVTYSYDGDGKRVQKSNGKLYWYGMSSDPLDETDLQGSISNSSFFEYVFFGGQRIARRDSSNNVNYYFSDHLGSAHVVTNAAGTVLDDSDFYPFGGERPVTSSSGNHYKFTAKERDSESGLDNFGARYNASSFGRFMSPTQPLSTSTPKIPKAGTFTHMYETIHSGISTLTVSALKTRKVTSTEMTVT